jgi:hypothetical protein
VPGDATRALTDLFFRRGVPRSAGVPSASETEAAADAEAFPTKSFRRFLSALSSKDSPVILDLGPIVGSNVSFLGERLGCKIVVEDLYADVERHARQGLWDSFAEFLKTRFTHKDHSVDGILCWDLFDYLDRTTAAQLASELVRMLRPGGALLGFFANAPIPELRYWKYIVTDDVSFQRRSYSATRGRQAPLANRDIQRIFEGLSVSDSFLLKINTREILLRKPSPSGAASPSA